MAKRTVEKIDLSIVVPVYNEEGNVAEAVKEINDSIEKITPRTEIIFVDDGSKDKTFTNLKKVQEQYRNVKIIRLRRNFGQTAAMSAGFDLASGSIIVTMDGDLQNDPKDIKKLIGKIQEGFDLVSGWRHKRKDGFLFRKVPSWLANSLISFTTDVKLHDYGCTLKAFRKEVIENIRLYGEMHRFIPAIASWMGVNIAEVKVNHRPRTSGKSKYGLSRTMRVILDLITVKYLLSFSSRPLQFFGAIGAITGLLGGAITGYLTIQRLFFDVALSNRPILLLGVLLIFTGLQFVTVGLLAEMQTRTYHETQSKPTYVIREIVKPRKNKKSKRGSRRRKKT